MTDSLSLKRKSILNPLSLLPIIFMEVLSGLRGTNEVLETALEQLLNKRGVSMLHPDPDTSCQEWKQYGE